MHVFVTNGSETELKEQDAVKHELEEVTKRYHLSLELLGEKEEQLDDLQQEFAHVKVSEQGRFREQCLQRHPTLSLCVSVCVCVCM